MLKRGGGEDKNREARKNLLKTLKPLISSSSAFYFCSNYTFGGVCCKDSSLWCIPSLWARNLRRRGGGAAGAAGAAAAAAGGGGRIRRR